VHVEGVDVGAEHAGGPAAFQHAVQHGDGRAVQVDQPGHLGHVLGLLGVLDPDELDERRVGLVVVEGDLGQAADRGDRVQVVDVDGALGQADLRVRAFQHRQVELLLAAEVVVDHPFRGAGPVGDLVDPGAAVAAEGELVGGHVEQLRAGALGVALPLHHGGRRHLHRHRLILRVRRHRSSLPWCRAALDSGHHHSP
jgi:hypothetical protein